MNLKEIFKKIENFAPVALSDEFCKTYGGYDNSGIIIDCKQDITGALFSLDLSSAAIAEAQRRGFNLIVTHHPAIYGGISRISADDNIGKCLKAGISVISMHLNFDAAVGGIDEQLMRGLGGSNATLLEPLSSGGYGRVYDVEETAFADLRARVAKTFDTDRALFYGDGGRKVKKIASFCGAGCSGKSISFARANGADVFVSSDMKHHEIAAIIENGINVIHLTHYSAENYGFKEIYKRLSAEFPFDTAFFADRNLL